MDCQGCEFIPDLYYDQAFQIWVTVDANGLATIGMTDISQSIAGNIMHIRVRRPGTRRPPGKPVATIESAKWAGPVPNFFECTIEDANLTLLNDPSLLNKDPYGAWIARVRLTESADIALRDFVTGEIAKQGYLARIIDENIECRRLED